MRLGLVADAGSLHTRPWVDAFRKAGHEVLLFSVQRGEILADLDCDVTAPLVSTTFRAMEGAGTARSAGPFPEGSAPSFASAGGSASDPSAAGVGPNAGNPAAKPARSDRERVSALAPGLPGTIATGSRRSTWELRWITRALRLIPSYRRWLREVRPDRIVALRLQPEGYLASFGFVRPLAVMSWGQDVLHYALRHPAHRWFARRTVRAADLFLGETEAVLEGWRSLGAPADRVKLGFTGLDRSFWRPPSREEREAARARLTSMRPGWTLSLGQGAPCLLSPRAVAERGHQESLLRGLAAAALPDVLLVQAGPGDRGMRPRCLALAASLGLKESYFDVGVVPAETLRDLAWAADGVVSLWSPDGLSQSLLEGMAAGLIPLAADIPGNREWIDPGKSGLLVDPSDAAAVGRALNALLTDTRLRTAAPELNAERIAGRADRKRNMERLTDMILRMEAPRKRA